MPAVVALLARTRAHGGQHHPGGIQWWLRELGREGFDAFVVDGSDGREATGFVMFDDGLVIAVADGAGADPSTLQLCLWAENVLAARGIHLERRLG